MACRLAGTKHYLKQCWNVLFIGHSGTNFSEILIAILYILIEENAFKNVLKMASILSRPQCVKLLHKGALSSTKIDRNYHCQLRIKQHKFSFCVI